jgi:EmrB/QacA subfamily drug resistance transporter
VIDDRRSPSSPAGSGVRRWLGLAVLGLGVAMIVMDITIVNVALPRIIANLDLEVADAGWVNSIYPLVFASLLITLGRVGDLWGRKRLFVLGLAVFALASLLAGRADGLVALVMARALQGVGASMVLPATLSIVNVSFRGRDRAIAFGMWGSIIGGMAAVGPLVGGWLTTEHGWRWVFYVNIPLALVTIAAALVLVDDLRDPSEVRRGFDPAGFVAVTVGLFGLVLGLIEGSRYGWWILQRDLVVGSWSMSAGGLSPVPLAFALGAAGIAVFVTIERSRGERGRPVLFDLAMFRLRSFRNGNLLVTIVGLGEFGLVFVLPLFVQTVLRYSAFETGLLFVAMAVGGFLGGPAAAVLAIRYGPRQVVSLGMALEAAGVLGVVVALDPAIGGSTLAPLLFVYGAGVGLASAQLTSVVLAEVPPAQSGQASGMQSTFRQVGAALGIALLGTVYVGTLGGGTEDRLLEIRGLTEGQRERIVGSTVDSAGFFVDALRLWTPDFAPVADAVADAITEAARRAALLALGVLVVGLVMSRRLPNVMGHARGSPRRHE